MTMTTRTAGFCKAMVGTLALMVFQLGCTQDQLVNGDAGHEAGHVKMIAVDGDYSEDGEDGEDGEESRGAVAEQDGRESGVIEGGDEPLGCGETSVQALTAGQSIDIGSLAISNDAESLRVRFNTTGGWLLAGTHVHVGSDRNDVPKASGGQPIPGQFDHVHTFDIEGGAAGLSSDTFVIPLSALDLAAGECGAPLYVWAHAESYLPGDGGEIAQRETAWGGDIEGNGSDRWFSLAYYQVTCCDDEAGAP